MNTRKYASRSIFWATLFVALMGLFVSGLMVATGHPVTALLFITLVSVMIARPRQGVYAAVTLSVPEILMDVLEAFKLQTPELFGPQGFSTDFSSKTAVLGDKITAKIDHIPVTGAYDPNNGGFKAAAQDVTTIIEDVPVTLNQFRVVTIKVGWLTQLSSKIPLYQRAVANYGYALGKYVVDTALAQVTPANFSNAVHVAPANINLDTMDGSIRNQMNSQKTFNTGRFMLCGSTFAQALGSDDRVRSSLFYNMLNGGNGYRVWRDISGFSWVREYPDFPQGNNLLAVAADSRAICVATRKPDYSNVADELGVPKVMEFHQIGDDESGIVMTGVSWQEYGTGDVYLAAGILFGVSAGNQGGNAGTITDNAAALVLSQ